MSKQSRLNKLRDELAGASAEELLVYFAENYKGKITFSSSMAVEDQVVTDLIFKTDPSVKIFTLDTGRLPEETYDVIERTRQKYGIDVRVYFPESSQVEEMTNLHGPNFFRDSVESRKHCCFVRKIEPLKRALDGIDVWICGLRKEQSVTRTDFQPIEWDEQFGVIKVSPILEWSTEQVWGYVKKNNVPYNDLHDQGYPSIGCECCTRAIKDGEDIRAGRWWWENPEHKECGLHWNKKAEGTN